MSPRKLRAATVTLSLMAMLIGAIVIISVISNVLMSPSVESKRDSHLPIQELLLRQQLEFLDSLEYGYVNASDLKESFHNNVTQNAKTLSKHLQEQKRNRPKRALGDSDLFAAMITGISGGFEINMDKTNISSAVDMLTTNLANPVIITRRHVRVNDVKNVQFLVDSTVTKLAIEARTSCCRANFNLTDPKGNSVIRDPDVQVRANSESLYLIEIGGNISTGNWSMIITDNRNQTYDIVVHASSLVNFELAYCDKAGIVVAGQPLPDSKNTYVTIIPYGFDRTSNWTYLLLKDLNSNSLQRIPLGRVMRSHTSEQYLVPVTWPNQDVYVGVEGCDVSGIMFTRELLTLIQPLGIRLTLDNPVNDSIKSCNKPFVIPLTITNAGNAANFTIKIDSDNANFAVFLDKTSVRIDSHLSVRIQGRVSVMKQPAPGESVTVVIHAEAPDGRSQYVQQNLYVSAGLTCLKSVTDVHEATSHRLINKRTVTVEHLIGRSTTMLSGKMVLLLCSFVYLLTTID